MASLIPENQAKFTLAEIQAETKADLQGSPSVVVRGVTTDTRSSLRGKLFVALKGERFDGHRFLDVAVESGASALLVARDSEVPVDRLPVLRVDSTLDALGALGRAHRKRCKARVVAVAGSAGKTTTRTTIKALLEGVAPGQVHSPPGNLNNLIGVPMVLLAVEPKHRFVVVELGTNQRGEIERLGKITLPDLVVLTLIDLEHTEGIGALEDVAAEEGDALAALGPNGIAVANQDDPLITSQLARCSAEKVLGFGFASGADYQIVKRDTNLDLVSEISVKRSGGAQDSFRLKLLGDAGALAATAALASVEALGQRRLSGQQISSALETLRVEPGRLNPVTLRDGTLLIDDSYNANPASVRSSSVFAWEVAQRRGARLVLVIGEMRELGELSESAHRELGQALAELAPDDIIVVGPLARPLYSSLDAAGVAASLTDDAVAAAELLEARLQPGDVVLVKASRGVRAESIIQTLVKSRGRAA